MFNLWKNSIVILINARFIEYLLCYKALGNKEVQEMVFLEEFILKLEKLLEINTSNYINASEWHFLKWVFILIIIWSGLYLL